MLSCNIWFSASSFWMGGGLESHCVGRVYGADGAVRHTRARAHTYTHTHTHTHTHESELDAICRVSLKTAKTPQMSTSFIQHPAVRTEEEKY